MAFLIVAGITVLVAPTGAVKKSPERIGTSTRAFAGNLRTTVRAEKRSWQFTTKWIIDADAAALETAVANGAHVACSGTALNASVNCEVTLQDANYVFVRGGFRRQVVLLLKEV